MISKKKWAQFGHAGNKKTGIVIHNTNNPAMSAEDLEKWLNEDCRTSQGCHYFVDHKEVREVMPLSWSVYNVGNGIAYGNTDCIAIEICSNLNDKLYLEGQAKAVALIKDLMKKYNIPMERIYFHRDFQRNVNCPAQILRLYGNKSSFLALLKGE